MKLMKMLTAIAMCVGFLAGSAKADVVQYTLELDASASTFSIFAQVFPENGTDFDSGGLGNVTLQIHGLNEPTDTISMQSKTVVYGGADPNDGFMFKTKTVGLALPLGIPPAYINGVLNGAILQIAGDVAQPGLGQIDGLLFPSTSDINGTQQPNLSPIISHPAMLQVATGNFSTDINGISLQGSNAELLNLENTAFVPASDVLFQTLIVNEPALLDLSFTLGSDPSGATLDLLNPVWGEFVPIPGSPAAGSVAIDYEPARGILGHDLVVSFDLVDDAEAAALVADLNALVADAGDPTRNFLATLGPGGHPEADFFVTFFDADSNSEGVIDFVGFGSGVVAVAIPEPATMSLFVLGGLALVRRRRLAA